MKTAMQDLREDIQDTITLGIEVLEEIKDEKTRNYLKSIFEKTLNSVTKRIDEELLDKEKQQIIDANNAGWRANRKKIDKNANDYYNEKFKNY